MCKRPVLPSVCAAVLLLALAASSLACGCPAAAVKATLRALAPPL